MADRSDQIKRVLVTGASGSAARYFFAYLKENHPNVEVHGAVRRKAMRKPVDGVILHEVDLLDMGSILDVLSEAYPDVIFHFAANSDKGFEVPSAIIQNNAVGTVNLFEAVRRFRYLDENEVHSGLNPIIVNVSSSEVYGDVLPTDVPISEDCPFRPMSPYAISKAAQDHLGRMYWKAYGMPVVTTRAFSYVNLYHRGIFTSAFAYQIALIERGQQSVLKHGNLDSVRCFVDAKDIMEAYWLAATRCRFGEAYNIGGDCVMSVGDVLKKLLRIHYDQVSSNVKVKQEQDPSLMRPADVTMQVPDCSKFRDETGWRPTFDTDKVLRELLDHWRRKVVNEGY